MDWEKDGRPVKSIIKANAWTEKGARTLSLTSLPFYISLFYSETFSKDISKKSMLISGPEFLLYIWGFHQFPGREGKCNILFCKYVYHSLREFVKMWSLDIWKTEMVLKISRWIDFTEKNVIVVNQMWIIQYYSSLHVDLTES